MISLFWFALIFLAYTLVGYPVMVWILSFFWNRTHNRRTFWPTVSIIITVHNEAQVLGNKIANTLGLTYPEAKREIIVASDGSEDGTVDVARSFASQGVKLIEISERRGKHYAQMIARDVARGQILVFTDASVYLKPDALQAMVSNFADRSVGCVSSEDQVVIQKRGGIGERSYVGFEMNLRRLEARIGSLVSVSGSFFAVRRELCRVWHPDQSSDFFIALHAVANGFRAVVDPECFGYLGSVRSDEAELRRKVRTVVHGLDVFFTHLEMLNPIRYGFFPWQFLSHKLFRWLTPFMISFLFISSAYLWRRSPFYSLSLVVQVGAYGAGLLALATDRLSQFKAFKLAGFFLLGNAATLMAWWYFFAGERFVTWQPTRRS